MYVSLKRYSRFSQIRNPVILSVQSTLETLQRIMQPVSPAVRTDLDACILPETLQNIGPRDGLV